jgi:hypothetical protein
MLSIEQKYSDTVTLLQDGGIPLTAIREATKNIPSLEGKLNVLEAYCKDNGIDAHSQYTALVEDTVLNGKLTSVEINEAVAGCDSSEKKLAKLKKRLSIKENKPTRIIRNNGGRVDFTESAGRPDNEERVKQYQKKFKCSFREAHIACGLPDPGPNMTESVNAITDRAKRWKRFSPSISEADALSIALKGVEPR